MMKKILFIGSISLFAMACGGSSAPTNTTNTNSANTNVNAANNVANNAVNRPTNTANPANAANTNTPAVKPTESGPKRVSFAAGKSEGTESVSLAAGESKQFVFGAKTGQIFMAEADSIDLEITMVKGKDSAQMKEPGYYDSTLLDDGDYVFQVKNPTKKEVKSSIKVIISNRAVSNR